MTRNNQSMTRSGAFPKRRDALRYRVEEKAWLFGESALVYLSCHNTTALIGIFQSTFGNFPNMVSADLSIIETF